MARSSDILTFVHSRPEEVAHADRYAERSRVLRAAILDLVGRYHAAAHARPPFNPDKPNIPVSGRVYGARDMQLLVDSALDFWLTIGVSTPNSNRNSRGALPSNIALTVNSGSSANLVAFMALTSPRLKARQLRPGDEVITCATGFPTTINPILQANMVRSSSTRTFRPTISTSRHRGGDHAAHPGDH